MSAARYFYVVTSNNEMARTGEGFVGIIPGSWEGPDNWDDFRRAMEEYNLETAVARIPATQNPEATRTEWAKEAAESIHEAANGRRIDVIAAYSAGGVIAEKTTGHLNEQNSKVGHIALLSASLGKPAENDPSFSQYQIPSQRSSERFQKSIKILPNKMTTMGIWEARELIYSRVPRALARLVLNRLDLQPQYRPDDLPLERFDTPATYIWDPKDPVRNPDWVRQIIRALDLNEVRIPSAGHAIHLSRPNELAGIMAGIIAGSRGAARVPRQRNGQNSPLNNPVK